MKEQQPGINHRYPTRFSLRKFSTSSQSQVAGVQNKAGDQGHVACRKRNIISSSPYLPIDIIFKILLLLPARVLHEVMRYVCKEWNRIVSDSHFISAHAHRQLQALASGSSTMIVQDLTADLDEAFLYLEKSSSGENRYRLNELRIPFPAKILGSCNGLVLLHDWRNAEILHVWNPVTGVKVSTLPPAVELLSCPKRWRCVCLAYASSSGHYKVVRLSKTNKLALLQVCTVGVDRNWRRTFYQGQKVQWYNRCVFIRGLVYWFGGVYTHGFGLDVDNETMFQFREPQELGRDDFAKGHYMIMETGLGVWHLCGPNKWDVWELVDPKSGTWVKVLNKYDFSDLLNKLKSVVKPSLLRPVLFLNNGEIWIYTELDPEDEQDEQDEGDEPDSALACYDRTSGNLSSLFPFDCTFMGLGVTPYPHVNTLLSL